MAKCGVCDQEFETKRGLRSHKKKVHGGYFTSRKEERDKPLAQSIPYATSIISMDKDEAKAELKEYRELLKTRSETHLKQMKEALVQLSKGRKILNVVDVIKSAGLNEKGQPKLAISRADQRMVTFQKIKGGGGLFMLKEWPGQKDEVRLPAGTFPDWPMDERASWKPIIDRDLRTVVPIIPAQFMPKGKLENYYILWEVDEWTLAPPQDPILLKRINETNFAVLSVWDLTPLERSIIAGGAN